MRNAKEELLDNLKKAAKVKCAHIYRDIIEENNGNDIVLKVGYTPEDFEKFLESLNFEYDQGYGVQELYGTVWLEDNTWLRRAEYDGSEWWEHYKLPEISEKCE